MNKYSVICIDPPWVFSDQLKMSDVARGAEANYSVMSIDNIKALPIGELAAEDGALLALWVPSSLLKEGISCMEAYGFELKQTYIWVKSKKEPLLNLSDKLKKTLKQKDKSIKDLAFDVVGDLASFSVNEILAFYMGRLFRQTHEICLIGINNTKIYKKLKNKSQRSVCIAENLKHSAKPENLQDSLDLMFPDQDINKIEIFARRQRNNWKCIGNEAPDTFGEDITVSLNNIIKSFSDA